MLRQANTTISETNSTNLPCSGPENVEGDGKSSEKKEEEGSNVVYSTVKWKSKKKKGQDSVDMDQPGSSYLEEECMVGDMCRNAVSNAVEMGSLHDEMATKNVKMESEYAQVKFKVKNDMQK